MKKIFLALLLLAVVGFAVSKPNVKDQPHQKTETPVSIDFTARFEIYTNGTKRIFTDPKYHNLTSYIYIQDTDPGLIYIKEKGVTWDDFFKTLPMSLTKDCLVTGTKQTFCSNETQKLKFFINDIEISNALEIEIKPGDFLKINYE